MIEPQAQVAALAPYALAELTPPKGKRLISLAQNESCMPPSPRALAAAKEAMEVAQLYPDPDWTDLRAAIAEVHDIDPDRILCGAGSMELIAALLRCYVGPGRAVLSTRYAYAFFRTAALAVGGAYRFAEECDYHVDVDAILDALEPDVAVVCVANPGNPTGTRISNDELVRLRDRLPAGVLLVVDEAYGEFVDEGDGRAFALTEQGNSVVLRTFSKAYCLAGARVGWGLFPEAVAAQVRKLINPNNVSTASQVAAAAAMRDRVHLRSVCRETVARRARFTKQIEGFGLRAVPSCTNFVLIEFSDADAAGRASVALHEEGIVMRGMGGYGLPQCLRATVGAVSEMDLAATVLSRHLVEERRR